MIHIIFNRLLQLALEVVAETKPSSGKSRESYNTLMRLVEGDKEVAWAETQNSVILPRIIAPRLVDDAESNVSPAFLQSSGILTCHTASLDTTQLDGTIATAVDDNNDDSFNDECSGNFKAKMLNSSYAKMVNVTENTDDSEIVSTSMSHFHDSKNVTPYWAEKTPVAMAINRERGVATPLACTATVTKLPKSPHPRTLKAKTEVNNTPSNFSISVKSRSPYVPSSLVREKHSVGMATSKHNNMAATPKCGNKSNANDHKNVVSTHTPGSKQPFANLPPIFAPTLMKSVSSDEATPNNCQSELDCNTGTPVVTGFEDDFVPFNAHDNKNLSPSQVEHDMTYHIDKESSVFLNRTYTQALDELEEEEHIVDRRDSKAAARKVGHEIWQKVRNTDYPQDQQPAMFHPLSSLQCDGEAAKKVPGYLSMTKSAAIKRLPSTRQPPLLRSNKENIPGGRKRTNTKQSNRTVRPLARSASLKSRPVTYNW